MDWFKTNICNALMKQSLTLIDKCLNNKRNYNCKFQMNKSLLVWTCHFRWCVLEGRQKNSIWPSCANSNAPSSIRSWILYFSIQHLLVSCPRLLEWYAHLSLGWYLGEEVLGFRGGYLNVTKFKFNMCCKTCDIGMLILVYCLLDISCLRRLPQWGCCWARDVVEN